eukprot:3934716-Rhodomonas_salina.1
MMYTRLRFSEKVSDTIRRRVLPKVQENRVQMRQPNGTFFGFAQALDLGLWDDFFATTLGWSKLLL